MIVYHGSTEIIKNPDVVHSKKYWILAEDFILRHSKIRQRNGQFEKVRDRKNCDS